MSFISKHKTWLLPVVIILLAILVFSYLKSSKPERQKPQATERAWPVEVVRLNPEMRHPEQRLFGQVQSSRMIRYVAPISAQVEQIARYDGERFKAGESLLALNANEVQLALQLAQADYQEAQAALELEKRAQETEKARYQQEQAILALKQQDLKRNQELMQRNLSSQSSVDQARDALTRQELAVMNSKLVLEQQQAKLAQVEARASRASANLKKARLNAERSVIRPDFEGRVATLSVAQGDQVNANTLLMELYPLDSLELKATIPVRHQALLQAALQEGKTIQAWYLDAEGESHALSLLRLAGQADASGLDGYFKLPESLAYLRPGELLDVRLALPERLGFVVSYSALYDANKVYVVNEENRLQARKAHTLGDVWLNGRKLALLDGELKEGERLVVTHLPNAIAGLLVNPTEVANER